MSARPGPHLVDLADAVGFRADRPAAELAAQARRWRRKAVRRDLLALGGLLIAACVGASALFSLLA